MKGKKMWKGEMQESGMRRRGALLGKLFRRGGRWTGMFIALPVLVSVLSMIGISVFWLHACREASFHQLSGFCETILESDPEAEALVLSSLKRYCEAGAAETEFLAQYGYDGRDFAIELQRAGAMVLSAAVFLTAGAFLAAGIFLYKSRRERIGGLTDYLEQVNRGSARTLLQTDEDCFSQLQDEIYKTVTNLYQTRDAAVKAKESFADNLANIAHQLKTPITAAFLSLQMLERAELPDFAERDRYAGQIKRQLERLKNLEEALLTLSKIDAGALRLERRQVDVYTVLNLAAENLEELLRKKQVSVDILEGDCVGFCGDMEWTMEALLNLMKNCLEHSSQGGTIHCSYSQNPLYTQIQIRDEGKGFAAEDIPHLFERFYRGKGAAGNGIGIGLSLSRSIIELQNGTVEARNLPEGGACFEVRLYRSR